MPAHRFNFYLPSLSPDLPELAIEGDEHHHLARVLRLDAGEVIAATDGRGLLVEAEVVTVGKTRTAARVTHVVSREAPSYRVVLAMSLLPRAHFEQAVSQCTEVGVTGIVPLIADKCHVKSWSKASAARAERVAVAAMKQSGRSWLPIIEEARTVEVIAGEVKSGKYGKALVGDTGGSSTPIAAAGPAIVLIGPEAGFNEREIVSLEGAGAARVSVASHRLRAETAAVVMVSNLAALFDRRGPTP